MYILPIEKSGWEYMLRVIKAAGKKDLVALNIWAKLAKIKKGKVNG